MRRREIGVAATFGRAFGLLLSPMNDVFISYAHIDDQRARGARTLNAERLTSNAEVAETRSLDFHARSEGIFGPSTFSVQRSTFGVSASAGSQFSTLSSQLN